MNVYDISGTEFVDGVTTVTVESILHACASPECWRDATAIYMHSFVYMKMLQRNLVTDYSDENPAGLILNKKICVRDDLMRSDELYETKLYNGDEVVATVISREQDFFLNEKFELILADRPE